MTTHTTDLGAPMATRAFDLGDILSVTTGRLVSARHMDGIYDVLNFMSGDNLLTHQLPRVCDEVTPAILAQHPDLNDVQVPTKFRNEAHVRTWLAEQVDRFGAERALIPMAAEDHTRIDPIAELRMMRPDMPIVGFNRE